MNKDFKQGAKDSLPIVAAYFSVSFSFGIMAANFGISPFIAGLISLTNLTSAGQFAGLKLIAAGGGIFEMVVLQFIINLRYSLMSLTLTQNLADSINTLKRLIISFVITDEIFATAATRSTPVNGWYMFGLGIFPYISWASGTITGAIANNLLPLSVQSALGIALYGMFIGIVVPELKVSKNISKVVIFTIIISCLMKYAPVLNQVSSGFSIIICTVLASAFGAAFFPIASKSGADAKEE